MIFEYTSPSLLGTGQCTADAGQPGPLLHHLPQKHLTNTTQRDSPETLRPTLEGAERPSSPPAPQGLTGPEPPPQPQNPPSLPVAAPCPVPGLPHNPPALLSLCCRSSGPAQSCRTPAGRRPPPQPGAPQPRPWQPGSSPQPLSSRTESPRALRERI